MRFLIMKNKFNGNALVALLVALLCTAGIGAGHAMAANEKAAASSAATVPCVADPAWFTAPSMPTEVKQSGGPGDSTFCDFYQFSWQTLAYLMAQSKVDPKIRNFEDTKQYYE